jgi:hypothetical protein
MVIHGNALARLAACRSESNRRATRESKRGHANHASTSTLVVLLRRARCCAAQAAEVSLATALLLEPTLPDLCPPERRERNSPLWRKDHTFVFTGSRSADEGTAGKRKKLPKSWYGSRLVRVATTLACSLLNGETMRIKTFLLVPAVLAFSAPAFATVMILPVKGTNLEPGEVDAIGQMITTAYQQEAKDTTIPPDESAKVVEETGGYPQAAQKAGAKEYVYVTAVRLNSRISLNATRYSADGKYIYSAKMSATSLDDIEPAAERLSKALLHQQSAADARTTENVMRTEEQQPIRAQSQKVAGFKGSFIYPIGWKESVAAQMAGALDVRLESGQHFIELGIGLTFSSPDHQYSYGGIWLDIGGDFYLTDSNVAPYLGGGLMPRLMWDDGESLANFAPYVQGGVMFFRDSKTRIYTDFRLAQNVLPIVFTNVDLYSVSDKKLYPTELTFSVGMGF